MDFDENYSAYHDSNTLDSFSYIHHIFSINRSSQQALHMWHYVFMIVQMRIL